MCVCADYAAQQGRASVFSTVRKTVQHDTCAWRGDGHPGALQRLAVGRRLPQGSLLQDVRLPQGQAPPPRPD